MQQNRGRFVGRCSGFCVVNVLVDLAQHVEHEQELTAEESTYRACIMRFRPMLMITMAALLGGVPTMLGTGVGSEIRQPLGYAIVGGLAVSRVLTLYTARWSISIWTDFRPGCSGNRSRRYPIGQRPRPPNEGRIRISLRVGQPLFALPCTASVKSTKSKIRGGIKHQKGTSHACNTVQDLRRSLGS